MINQISFKDALIGHKMSSVFRVGNNKEDDNTDDSLHFIREDGKEFEFFHRQDCCESVWIEDIVGDLNDLVGTPILSVDEECNTVESSMEIEEGDWTFYKFATIKGYVTVRWCGQSDYYSTSVSFMEVKPKTGV